ncbi:MAG TPA: glycosyltransferase [Nitrospiraceae bacterium]|nr:glycosyltransferase [Nitrospiraceae bacterium]
MTVRRDIKAQSSDSSPQHSALSTQGSGDGSQHCLVSVVVPTYRRPELLNRCLTALFMQTMEASRYEIIVVDDGPTDETREVVLSWSRRSGPRLRYLANEKRHGPAAARNRGWQAAAGDIIAFTDDDCIPAADWLAVAFGSMEDPTVDGVSGRIIVPVPSVPTDYEQTVAGLEHGPFATANCLYRRRALSVVGGFDERFTVAWREDTDLEFALRAQGHRLVCQPAAIVVHPVRPARWGVSVALQRNNIFNALLYKKHPVFYRWFIQAVPPWRYYLALVALLGAGLALAVGSTWGALIGVAIWLGLTVEFCRRRLTTTSHRLEHVAEMIVTSALIPPLAIFWRLRGALRYRVVFL